MADEFCFSLLQTSTLEILQAAGFNAGQSKATHVLTNVFEQYLELLSTTTSAYSQLSGRTTGNILDCIDSFRELAIDIPTFKSWLAEEATLLSPTWTEQGDPSRILNGIVNSGLNRQKDSTIYEFKEFEKIEKKLIEVEIIYEEEEENNNNKENNNLPDYIPSYFPPFPVTAPPKEEHEDELAIIETKTQLPTVASDTMPLPNIVRKKTKPVDNPFTFLKPFEESVLSTIDTDQPEALSLSIKVDTTTQSSTFKRKRKDSSESLLLTQQLISEIKYHDEEDMPNNKRKIIGDVSLYNETTKDGAAPGNTMFSQEFGLLEKFMTDIAPRIAIPKLMTPNMMIDMLAPSQGATTPTSSSTIRLNMTPTHNRKPSLGGITIEELPPGSTTVSTPNTTTNASFDKKEAPTNIKTAPVSLAAPSSDSTIEEKKKEKKDKKEKSTKSKKKLTISLPKPKSDLLFSMANQPKSSTTEEPSDVSSSTTTTPVIRFTLKPPSEEQQQQPLKSETVDVINCICDNPTVDYGAFMVACDTCGTWYHGTCVGIAETDQIEEWHCVWCQKL